MELAEPTRMAGAIEVYEDAFDDCGTLLAEIEEVIRSDWARALVGHDQVSDNRTSDMAFIDLTSLRNPVPVFEFARKLYAYLDEYGKRYDVGFSRIEPACLNRYKIGQEYKAHADAGPGHPRAFSALLYMNDVDEGGETYFPLFDVTITPKAGRLVIFPSDFAYIHEARPPKSGLKYSLAVWVDRMP